MRHDITADSALLLLDRLAVRTHAPDGVILGELVGDERGLVQAGERDELPAVAQLGETLDVGFLALGVHGRLPVEGGGEVVREPVYVISKSVVVVGKKKISNSLLLGPNGVNALCKLPRLLEIGQFALHPYHIAVRRVRHGSVDRALAATLVPVVTFPRPRGIPIEMHVHARQPLGESPGLGIALSLALGEEVGDEGFLVDVHARVDGVDYGVRVEFEVRLRRPVVFDCLELGAVLAGLFGGDHEFGERLEGGVRAAEDVGVVARIDCRGDEGCGFGVGAGDGQEVGSCKVSGQCAEMSKGDGK